MSITQPLPQSTVIKAYKGVAWDNSLKDIRWFATAAERESYLASLQLATWNNCSIVSTGKSIRVEGEYNACVECNYLTWQNGNSQSGVPGRKFFAWITAVNYVNAQTVEFQYEVDWIQTYRFDFVIGACLVLREHVNDDTFGKWLLDEHLETGEYLVQAITRRTYLPAVILNVLRSDFMATVMGGVYQAGITYVSPLNEPGGITLVNTILNAYNNTPERITYFGMGVASMCDREGTTTDLPYQGKTFLDEWTSSGKAYFGEHEYDESGFVPQNNKTLTYPYRLAVVDNFNGMENQIRYELATNKSVTDIAFQIAGMPYPRPIMQCWPDERRGMLLTDVSQNMEGIVYDNFPMVTYATDSFKAWVSEFGESRVASMNANVVTTAASMAQNILGMNIGGLVSAGAGFAQDIINYNQETRSHQLHSVQAHGGAAEAALHYSRGEVGFRCTHYSITPDRAKEIDKYFTRYGYRVDTVKTPNITGRQYFNYVQCREAEVAGNIAVDAKLQMEEALTKGTTFWHINNMTSEISSNPIVAT